MEGKSRTSACNEFSIIFGVPAHLRSMASKFSPRVLCVEDDDNIRFIAVEALQDAGFDVLEASNGARALDLMKYPDSVDVLFTDVSMPGRFDGIELVDQVRTEHPHIPVLVTSGFAANLSQRLAKLSPPAVFVSKPYSLTKIVRTLQVLASSESPRSE